MEISQDIETLQVIEHENVFKLSMLDTGIILVEWSEEIVEITKEHLILLVTEIKDLGGGKRMRVFVGTQDFSKINKEAMEYSSTPESSKYTLANAVLVNNLAKKILFNFYMKFDKPTVPTRAFRSQQEGFDWLLSLSDKH